MNKPNPNAPHLTFPDQFKKFKELGLRVAFDATYQMQQYHGWLAALDRMGVLTLPMIRDISMGKLKVVPNPDYEPREEQN